MQQQSQNARDWVHFAHSPIEDDVDGTDADFVNAVQRVEITQHVEETALFGVKQKNKNAIVNK